MLLSNLNILATAPDGVAKLRELILTLAVQGKLVPQDPMDEPASVLLKKIRAEKDRLIAEGKIKRDKPLAEIAEEEKPFELPQGWEWVRLGRLANFIDYRGKTPTKTESGIPLITAKNVRQGFIYRNPREFIAETAYAGWMTRGFPKLGDLLFTTEAPLGNVAVIDIDERFALAQRVICFGLYESQMSGALATFLRSPWMQSVFAEQATGVTAQGIKSARLQLIPIPVAPLAEQSRIATRVEELMRLCDALQAKARLEATQHAQLVTTLLSTLTASTTTEALTENWHRVATHFDLLLDRPEAVDALEQTILQLAVRGLLVPQDPQDEPASQLLKKIRAEKDKLIAEGKIKRDKPLSPIADDEKPFELPMGWEWVRLNDLIKIGSGDGLTAAQMAPAGTVPVYGGNGVNGHHDHANVEEPTVVIGRVGYYCGSVHITPARAWVTDNAFITRYPKVHLDMEWLYWLLVGTNLKENDAATAQPVISGRKLYPIVVALPPLAEQSRIVARVASLRALCADLRQRLAAARTQQTLLAQVLVENVA